MVSHNLYNWNAVHYNAKLIYRWWDEMIKIFCMIYNSIEQINFDRIGGKIKSNIQVAL
jgi:hypothetical protein